MSRFYSLFRNFKGFRVAFQSVIPKGEQVEKYLTQLNEKVIINAERGQIFHPAEEEGIKGNHLSAKLVFTTVTNNAGGERRMLVFFSQHQATCGRFGEDKPFGFEKCQPGQNYKGFGYLSLAFPGITGRFTSLYAKINPRDAAPLFVKISAEEKEGKIIVTAEKVFYNQLPQCLKN
jgi:hypothetical protein